MRLVVLLFSIIVSASACATQIQSSSDELGGDWQIRQAECWNAWSEIIEEWKDNGGGLKLSIVETRHQIANDKRSRFSKYVRAAWAAQARAANRDEMSRWPLSNDELYVAIRAYSDGNPSDPPNNCGYSLLESILWREFVLLGADADGSVSSNGPKIFKFSDAPDTVKWTSPDAPRWTYFWLLRRMD